MSKVYLSSPLGHIIWLSFPLVYATTFHPLYLSLLVPLSHNNYYCVSSSSRSNSGLKWG